MIPWMAWRLHRRGLIGFCVGGFVTYKIAERSADVAAAAPFYGGGYQPT